eukprot:GEZU01010127.1.p1 GENE.GEZU01010127.1~~GEZU01010127.1.p1  ORF type:complete len:230 (-),score=35.81 GEZU01010127.1:391-1080(-)
MVIFRDRIDAGKKLAVALVQRFKELGIYNKETVVLALPRGGLPVAAPLVDTLPNARLDVVVARKIGFPGHEEFAIGAVTARGSRVLNERVFSGSYRGAISDSYLASKTEEEKQVALRRERAMRGGHDMVPLKGKVAVLVDDGIATGMTMRAAVIDVKEQQPDRVVIAVPVLSRHILFDMKEQVDDIVYIDAPENFRAVGMYYDNFTQVEDDEAKEIMDTYYHKAEKKQR